MKTLLKIFPVLLYASVYGQTKTETKTEKQYTETFSQENCHFSHSAINTYFILRPGYQTILRGIEGKDTTELIVTVLNEIKTVGGTDTRVVEERESINGKLVEVSKNYVAVCKESGSLFYFGEDVDIYKKDSVIGHSGSWLAGGKNKPGILLPGMPLLGGRYYQELAPGIAMDRAEIVSVTDSMQTAIGAFNNVLKILETTPLDPKDKSYKYYAPNIGLIQDGNLKIIKFGAAGK